MDYYNTIVLSMYGIFLFSTLGFLFNHLEKSINESIYLLEEDRILTKDIHNDNKLYKLMSLLVNTNNIKKNDNILILTNNNSTSNSMISVLNKLNDNIHLISFNNDQFHEIEKLAEDNNYTFIHKHFNNTNLFGNELIKYNCNIQTEVMTDYCQKNNINNIFLDYNFDDKCSLLLKNILENNIENLKEHFIRDSINYYIPFYNVDIKDLDTYCYNYDITYDNSYNYLSKNNLFKSQTNLIDDYYKNWRPNLIKNYQDLVYLNKETINDIELLCTNLTHTYKYGNRFDFTIYSPTLSVFSKLINNSLKYNLDINMVYKLYKHLQKSYLFEYTYPIDDDNYFYCKNNNVIIFDKTNIQYLINNNFEYTDDKPNNNNNLDSLLNGNFYYYTGDNSDLNSVELLQCELRVPIKILSLFYLPKTGILHYVKISN